MEESLQYEIKIEESLQNGIKREKSLQNGIKMKESLQNEIKMKESLQNEIIMKESLQNEVKRKESLQNEVKRKESSQNEIKMKESQQKEIKMEETLQNEIITYVNETCVLNSMTNHRKIFGLSLCKNNSILIRQCEKDFIFFQGANLVSWTNLKNEFILQMNQLASDFNKINALQRHFDSLNLRSIDPVKNADCLKAANAELMEIGQTLKQYVMNLSINFYMVGCKLDLCIDLLNDINNETASVISCTFPLVLKKKYIKIN
ncbi:hypothetical protein TNCV_3347661 [Trichonephila clavipes]|nr:hypothetical protein TNCV_3347661 [Trichonephila clavipes]